MLKKQGIYFLTDLGRLKVLNQVSIRVQFLVRALLSDSEYLQGPI